MTGPNVNLWMAYRYLIHLSNEPIEGLTSPHDERIITRCREILDVKARDVALFKMAKDAICEDYKTANPRMSMCARCPILAPAPDGSGYCCGLSLRAVECTDFNSDKTDSLATPKNQPPRRNVRDLTSSEYRGQQ